MPQDCARTIRAPAKRGCDNLPLKKARVQFSEYLEQVKIASPGGALSLISACPPDFLDTAARALSEDISEVAVPSFTRGTAAEKLGQQYLSQSFQHNQRGFCQHIRDLDVHPVTPQANRASQAGVGTVLHTELG